MYEFYSCLIRWTYFYYCSNSLWVLECGWCSAGPSVCIKCPRLAGAGDTNPARSAQAAMCEDDLQAGGRVSEQEAAAAQSQNPAASPGCNVQYSTQRRLSHPGKAFYAV